MRVIGQILFTTVLTGLLCGCATAPAPQPPEFLADRNSRAAYLQLLNETIWINSNKYGPDGKLTNKSADALRVLWKHARAGDAFALLIDDAGPAGRLYALCGLYCADPERFRAEIPYFKFEKTKVRSVFGTEHASERMRDIVFCPYPEASFRLVSTCPKTCNPYLKRCFRHRPERARETTRRVILGPEQTLAQWRTENSEHGFYLDISGGGYPSLFKHGDIKQ